MNNNLSTNINPEFTNQSVSASPLNTDIPGTNNQLTQFASSSIVENTAPILKDTNLNFNPIDEDAPEPAGSGVVGSLVSSLVSVNGNVTDKDPGALTGIAVISTNTTKGNWYFSIDDGKNWNDLNTASIGNARLLAADSATRIYFQPNPNEFGTISDGITFRAWDQSNQIANGETADTFNKAGGSTSFSIETDSASIKINSVNDAPFNTIPLNTEETPLKVNEDEELFLNNAIQVNDIDADLGSIQVTLESTNGTIRVNNTPDSGVNLSGNESASVTLTGQILKVNNILNGLIFKPTPNFNSSSGSGGDSFAYIKVTTSDLGNTGSGGIKRATDTIKIDVRSVNDAPTFTKGGDQSINEDSGAVTLATAWATNIFAGPSDELNQELEFIVDTVVDTPDKNLFIVDPAISKDGILTYTPADNKSGTATVRVKLKDKSGTDLNGKDESLEQTFTITVNPVNDAPINKVPLTSLIIDEDTSLTFSGENAISVSDVDAGTNDIQVTLTTANGILEIPTNTNIALRGNGTGIVTLTGTVTNINTTLNGLKFKPTRNFNGSTSIIISTNDQGSTGSGGALKAENTIKIDVLPVNNVPSFTSGSNQVVKEDAEIKDVTWARNIFAGADNESSQPLNFIVSNNKNSLFEKQPEISSTGVLTYKLAKDQNGIAKVTVQLQDNVGLADSKISPSQEFTIEVQSVNDAPVNNLPDIIKNPLIINEDESLVFSGNKLISISDIDIDIDDIEANARLMKVNLDTANGSLSVVSGIEQLSKIEGNGTANIILTGTLKNINAALNGLTFQPLINFNGDTQITITTNDQGAVGDSNSLKDTDTIFIKVNPINDAPFFTKGKDIEVNEDAGSQSISWATKISAGAGDESSQTRKFVIVSNDREDLFVGPEPIKIAPDGTLSYKLADNKNGVANITVRLEDNGSGEGVNVSAPQSFSITVKPVNDKPINTIPTDVQVVEEDSEFTFGNRAISISDIDADTNPTEIKPVKVTLSAAKGILSLLYADGNPAVQIEGNDTGKVQLIGRVDQINNILNGLLFKPVSDFNGDTTIEIVTDDQNTSDVAIGGSSITSSSIAIKVNPVNDAPFFTKGENIEVNEDPIATPLFEKWATNISAGASNESRQKLTFSVVSMSDDDKKLFAELPTIDGKTGNLSFKPAANAFGTATFKVTLKDDETGLNISDEQTFTIEVKPVNDAPVNNLPPTIQTVKEDGSLTFSDTNGISVSDIESVNTQIQVTLTTSNGILTLADDISSGSGTGNISLSGNLSDVNLALKNLIFKPTKDFNGEATIEVVTTEVDGGGDLKDSDTIKINVTPVNDAPMVTLGEKIEVVAGSGKQTFNTYASFTSGAENELNQTALKYSISNNSHPELFKDISIDAKGNLMFTPVASVLESTNVTVGVTVQDNGGTLDDGKDISEEKTFTITINPLLVEIASVVTSVQEGVAGKTTDYAFTITLSQASTEEITVDYATADGAATIVDADYVETKGTVTFKPGETSKTIKVAVKGDGKFEENQTFTVNLSNEKNVTLGKNTSAIGTIENDDLKPVVSIANVSKYEGNDGNTSFTFTAQLSNISDEEVSFDYITADGTASSEKGDYVSTSGKLLFAAGESSKTFTVDIVADTQFEANETFRIDVRNLKNATYSELPNNGIGTILDDEFGQNTDFTGDGKNDLLWRNSRTGEVEIRQMNGTTVERKISLGKIDLNWEIEHVADFNGDGNVDILWRNQKSGENALWLMKGETLEKPVLFDTKADENWYIQGVADFNSDRKLDILWRNVKSGEVAAWLMGGNDSNILNSGVYVSSEPIDLNWEIKGITDSNGDGQLEILWRNNSTGDNALWNLNGAVIAGSITFKDRIDTSWKIVGVADINNDGKTDFVWQNFATGEGAIWEMSSQFGELEKSFFLPKQSTDSLIERLIDLNGDNKIDVLYRNYRTGENILLQGSQMTASSMVTKEDDTFWKIA
ncbi:FG-GAP repeat domain-containing protein [Calothrix sp. PCC 6303]|uniref:FG-GAP repeat domain-containing protein n=1 Tax=Calothrix sp. PCC 6303 TaxID=1170562 RepID=UPI0002A02CCB|nr:VCBS repeat-containing protein [Calothrix sp. PCC 6303]AFZ00453.1 Na-Ca exchanger/integrin-beta4 [Calothrix sp. PCC 6303]